MRHVLRQIHSQAAPLLLAFRSATDESLPGAGLVRLKWGLLTPAKAIALDELAHHTFLSDSHCIAIQASKGCRADWDSTAVSALRGRRGFLPRDLECSSGRINTSVRFAPGLR